MLNRAIPLGVGIAGAARNGMLRLVDSVLGREVRYDVVDIGGRPLLVDLSHDSQRVLSYAFWNVYRYYRGSPLGKLILSMRPPRGSVFLDVGANLGIYAMLARAAGYQTWVFEPEPVHARFLRHNDAWFDRVFAIALSDASGSAELFVTPSSNPGASSLIGAGSSYVKTATVMTDRLDAVVEEHLLPDERIELIKIDVEGAETSTVRGCEGLLAAGCRPLIWCEVRGPSSGRAPNTYAEVSAFLRPFGYEPYCWRRGRAFPFAPRRSLPRVFDLLFVPDSRWRPHTAGHDSSALRESSEPARRHAYSGRVTSYQTGAPRGCYYDPRPTNPVVSCAWHPSPVGRCITRWL